MKKLSISKQGISCGKSHDFQDGHNLQIIVSGNTGASPGLCRSCKPGERSLPVSQNADQIPFSLRLGILLAQKRPISTCWVIAQTTSCVAQERSP